MFIVPVSRQTRQLSRLLDDSVERFFGSPERSAARSPSLDIAESDSAYTATLEVPGVTKEDLKVSVDGRRITVQAQRATAEAQAEPAAEHKAEAEREGERIVYRERSATRYARTFTLPVEVDQAEAGAKLEHGVLTLTLPKRGARSAAQLTIN